MAARDCAARLDSCKACWMAPALRYLVDMKTNMTIRFGIVLVGLMVVPLIAEAKKPALPGEAGSCSEKIGNEFGIVPLSANPMPGQLNDRKLKLTVTVDAQGKAK